MNQRPLTLLAVPGSLRRESLNRALATAALDATPKDVAVTVRDLDGVPLYNGDVEAAGTPAAVVDLKDAITRADGVLVVTPEYNRTIPGVVKNALDWISRKPNPLEGKPCAVISASPGGGGGAMAQPAVKLVLHSLKAELPPLRELAVKHARGKFTDGVLTDDETRERLTALLSEFAGWIRGHNQG